MFTTAASIRSAIIRREISTREVCRQPLDRIRELDGRLHAFQHVDEERALARAEALDRAEGPHGPLFGVPVALKDNLAVRDMTTTAGSRILERYVSPFD